MPYTLQPVEYDPFQADEAAASAPPVDYSQNGGLVAYGQNLKNQLSGYLENSWRGLQRIPGDVADYADTVGNTVAKPYLQGLNELYSTDWSKQPFVGVGEHGELTGRLPALAQVTVPFLAGGAPGGSLGAGMKIPGGYEGGYHGTPHTFAPEPGHPLGRFNDAAIGSGEGAQIYGYGHYVAGHQDTGDHYRTGSSLKQILLRGEPVQADLDSSQGMAVAMINTRVKDPDPIGSAIQGLQHVYERDKGQGYPALSRISGAIKWLQDNQSDLKLNIDKGNLYHVEIKPKEEELLDWDKGLHEQLPEVKEKLQSLLQEVDSRAKEIHGSSIIEEPDQFNGSDLYRLLTEHFRDPRVVSRAGHDMAPDQFASQALHEAGIPGIKYLDQGSRIPPANLEYLQERLRHYQSALEGAKREGSRYTDALQLDVDKISSQIEKAKLWQPTHNYVIFHPDNLRVVGKNGETIENHLQNVE